MTDETENIAPLQDQLSALEGGQFDEVTKLVEAEQRRRGEAGDEINTAEVCRMSGADLEAWIRQQGQEYQRRIATMSPAELADYKRGAR